MNFEMLNNVDEVFGIDINSVIKQIFWDCRMLNMEIELGTENLRECVNHVIEYESYDDLKENSAKRSVRYKLNHKGTYVSVKNLRIHMIELIEDVISLILSYDLSSNSSDKNLLEIPIKTIIVIVNIFRYLKCPLSEQEVLIYIAIYYESKSRIVTDDNIIDIINQYYNKYGFPVPNDKDVFVIVNKLLNELEIINIDDKGKYSANEKLIYEI